MQKIYQELVKSMMQKIDEIAELGEIKLIKNIEKDPNLKSRKELQEVLGIGPEIAEKLLKKNIRSVIDLKKKAKNGKIKLTKMQKIGLKYFKDLSKKIPRDEILYFKKFIEKILKKEFKNLSLKLAGSYRTGKKISKDIDIVIISSDIKTKGDLEKSNLFNKIIKILSKNGILKDYLNEGGDSLIGIMKLPVRIAKYKPHIARHVDLRLVSNKFITFLYVILWIWCYFFKKD